MKPIRLDDAMKDTLCPLWWAECLIALHEGRIVTPADEALAAIPWEQDGTVCPVCRHHGYQPFTIKQIIGYDGHECQWVDSARKVAALEEQ